MEKVEERPEVINFLKVDEYPKGYGYGSGYGYGDGYGDGSGYGYGSGYGDGSGYGHGDGYGLVSFDGQNVYYIDGLPTVIERVCNNLAKGYIINKDLTTTPCYVVKHENLFAHGSTVKSMDVEEKIDAFLKEFDICTKYPAKMFYEWHHKLTGSCEFGRNAFVKNHGIDLENGMYTVKEFIEITKDDFGGDIIKQIEERIDA